MGRTAALLLLVACGAHDDGAAGVAFSDRVAHGEVVARVGGAEIGLDDVSEVVKATGLSPRDALDRLVAEELLGDQAVERGYGRGNDVQRALKKARARALLEVAVEGEVKLEQIDDAAVRERFEQVKATLVRKETRRFTRLMIGREQSSPGLDGRALAESAFSRLSVLPEDARAQELADLAREARAAGAQTALEERERIVGAPGWEPALASAVDGMSAPGLVPRVVETRSAYELLFVSSVLAARDARLEDHADAIRAQLLTELRAARTKDLLDKLARATPVTYDEKVIERALADDTLLGNLP